MSLSAALSSARNAIGIRSAESDVVARNIAGVNDAGFSRKTTENVAGPGGAVRLLRVVRESSTALFTAALGGSSDAANRKALLEGVKSLQSIVDPSLEEATPTGRIGAVVDALAAAAAKPDDRILAQNVVVKAQALAQTLNDASATVQDARKSADSSIADSVDSIRTQLAQFDTINRRIMVNRANGGDVTSDLDERDKLLSSLSAEIGIRAIERPNGDMRIYTDSGVTLYDNGPRQISFQKTSAFAASSAGHAVMIDGMPVTGPNAAMPLVSGRIVADMSVRDEIAPSFQGQLDEIARGLVNAFQERDKTNSASSARAGLFRDGVSTSLPGASRVAGLAASISVATTVDQARGGNPLLLRDGGVSDPADPNYKLNTTNAASFVDRLQALSTALSATQTFDPANGAVASGSVMTYASASTGYIEGLRQNASTENDIKDAFLQRAQQSLSSATGVNLDQEMSHMLDLERAYQGSAKLISTIDSMFQSLLQVVG